MPSDDRSLTSAIGRIPEQARLPWSSLIERAEEATARQSEVRRLRRTLGWLLAFVVVEFFIRVRMSPREGSSSQSTLLAEALQARRQLPDVADTDELLDSLDDIEHLSIESDVSQDLRSEMDDIDTIGSDDGENAGTDAAAGSDNTAPDGGN